MDRLWIFKCNINNISGNHTLSIPDHLPQFLIYPNIFLTTQAQNPRQSDDGNCCGIFVNFQKTYDTKDHNVLLKILELYDIRGISNKWFASDLSSVIENNFCQFLILTLIFLMLNAQSPKVPCSKSFTVSYRNDLHCAIKYCKVYYFVDDTNLMNFQTSFKTINKQIKTWKNKNRMKLV